MGTRRVSDNFTMWWQTFVTPLYADTPEDDGSRSGPDRDRKAPETVEAVRKLRIAEFREVRLRGWLTQE